MMTQHTYGGIILYWMDLAMLCRHSLASCDSVSRLKGGFAGSPIPASNRPLGIALNLLDSLAARILLYGIYVAAL